MKYYRRLIAFLISPFVSALIVSALVFLIDYINGGGRTEDLLGKRDGLAFILYLRGTCVWTYSLAIFPGLLILLLLYKFNKRSLFTFVISGGLVAQTFLLLAFIEAGTTGVLSFDTLIMFVSLFFSGAVGASVYWFITEKPNKSIVCSSEKVDTKLKKEVL